MRALRAKVSSTRVRFRRDSFDLDLTYITPNVIGMSPIHVALVTHLATIADVAHAKIVFAL